MTRDEVKVVIRVIQNSYPNFKIANPSEMVDVWLMMLEDEDYRVISLALKSYIKSNRSGFAPSIGQLIDIARNMTTPELLTAEEAWSLTYRAICNGIYGAEAEYKKLPEAVQIAVGDPHQLTVWATDEHFSEGIVRTQFMEAYAAAAAKQTEKMRIPEAARLLIETVNKGSERDVFRGEIEQREIPIAAIEMHEREASDETRETFKIFLEKFKGEE